MCTFRWGVSTVRIALAAALATALQAQTLLFNRILASADPEEVSGVAADTTGVYLVGRPLTPIPPAVFGPGVPPFVRKTDFNGNELWTRRLPTSSYYSRSFAVAVAPGGIYIGGSIDTAPPGMRGNEVTDAFIAKYDAGGNHLWTRQFGTPLHDGAFGVAANAAGVYVVGEAAGSLPGTSGVAGVFIRKYDPAGNEQWTRQSSGYGTAGVAVDASGVYMVGSVAASNLSPVLQKYDADGRLLWTRPLSVRNPDFDSGLAVDGTGVYLAKSGSLIRFDTSGNELWRREYADGGSAVTVDGAGIYVGYTEKALPGQCSASGRDAVVRKYDTAGALVWTRQFGTYRGYQATGVAVDTTAVYAGGFEDGGPPARSYLAKREKSSPPADNSRPRIHGECVVNAASFLGGGVAPGEIVTIFGSAIGPVLLTPMRLTEEGLMPTTLADTRILFNGVPAALLYVSEIQSSAIVPYGVIASPSVRVSVEYKGVSSDNITLPVLPARSGLFSIDGSGRGQGAILNEDGTLNSPENPATRGSVVVLYATGEGLTNPPGVDGKPIGDIPPGPAQKVEVGMPAIPDNECQDCGVSGEILNAGAVSGSVPGLLQLNVRVPKNATPGSAVPVHLAIGPVWAPALVTVALR